MIASCMKATDCGDGVTFFCVRRFGHAGECSPFDASGKAGNLGPRCSAKSSPSRICHRPAGHAGACKFADVPSA